MNIIRADFDWFSLLAILAAGIIGMVKARGNKKRSSQESSPRPYYEYNEEKEAEQYPGRQEMPEPVFSAIELRTASEGYTKYDSLTERTEEYEEKPDISSLFEQEAEETPAETEDEKFDIRKAIISSEILKRPQY